jgi:MSHA biogenesis protein MshO
MRRPDPHRVRGFTLLELIIVIVISGVIAATISVFVRPAMDSYLQVRTRADLVEQGDTALRRMIRDVRTAVPNSIRLPDKNCFEYVPTSTGGSFRTGPDTSPDPGNGCTPSSTCSAPLDITQAVSVFDVLTPFSSVPAAGDQVVIGNQTPEQVYAGTTRATITGVATPATASHGRHRVSINSTQFPASYQDNRFTVTPASGPVFYVCSGATGVNSAGNGLGTLYRLSGYGWIAAYPSSCPNASAGAVLATSVEACEFVYDPNQGATQQNGFISLQLKLTRNGESTTLVFGAHVANAP